MANRTPEQTYDELLQQFNHHRAEEERLEAAANHHQEQALMVWRQLEVKRKFDLESILGREGLGYCHKQEPYSHRLGEDRYAKEPAELGVYPQSSLQYVYFRKGEEYQTTGNLTSEEEKDLHYATRGLGVGREQQAVVQVCPEHYSPLEAFFSKFPYVVQNPDQAAWRAKYQLPPTTILARAILVENKFYVISEGSQVGIDAELLTPQDYSSYLYKMFGLPNLPGLPLATPTKHWEIISTR